MLPTFWCFLNKGKKSSLKIIAAYSYALFFICTSYAICLTILAAILRWQIAWGLIQSTFYADFLANFRLDFGARFLRQHFSSGLVAATMFACHSSSSSRRNHLVTPNTLQHSPAPVVPGNSFAFGTRRWAAAHLEQRQKALAAL